MHLNTPNKCTNALEHHQVNVFGVFSVIRTTDGSLPSKDMATEGYPIEDPMTQEGKALAPNLAGVGFARTPSKICNSNKKVLHFLNKVRSDIFSHWALLIGLAMASQVPP